MKDENYNSVPDFIDDTNNWIKIMDTESDGLPDCVEEHIGSNPEMADSDCDGLDDYYEVFVTYTNPTMNDTDENGVDDGDEDFDADGLINIEEYTYASNPWLEDTDGDYLKDGEEVHTYGTDPLKKDTDEDGLDDGEEVYLSDFGMMPTSPDSDGDGIIDGNETFEQTLSLCIEDEESAVTNVSVNMSVSGSIEKIVSIENIMGIDTYVSDVVGLVGVPVDISCEFNFAEATITFTYDESRLGANSEDSLAMMWYDEENGKFVVLEDCVVDKENNTVSYVTTHFSKYLLVNTDYWFDSWRYENNYRILGNEPSVETPYYDIAFVVDVSGSMSGSRLEMAKSSVDLFTDAMLYNDHGCLVTFNDSASLVSGFDEVTYYIDEKVKNLSAGGGTNVASGLSMALDELFTIKDKNKQVIVLVCDGDVNYVTDLVDEAIAEEIAIYTVNVQNGNSSMLEYIANATGGYSYIATTVWDIVENVNTIKNQTVAAPVQLDSDGDGLLDVYEIKGIHMSNGHTITTDPENPDTDNDGVSDGDEVGAPITDIVKNENGYYPHILFNPTSSPLVQDSDGDYYYDAQDKNAYKWEASQIIDQFLDDSNSIDGKNPAYDRDYYSNASTGTLSLTSDNTGDGAVKNCFKFTRSNESIHGTTQTFKITPEKKCDYAITISNVNLNGFIDSMQEQNSVKISITYETGAWFWKDSKSVAQIETFSYDTGNSSLTFYYALNEGVTYTIDVYNLSSTTDYTVTVAQNNWVYAPNGGIRKGDSTAKHICLRINETYLTDAQVCTMYDAIAAEEIGRTSTSGMWAYKDAEDFLIAVRACEDDYFSNFVNSNDVTNRLSEQLEFIFVDPSGMVGAYGDFSLTASVALAFAPSESYASVLSTVTSGVNGTLLGLNIISALISHGYECKKSQFANALVDGKFNICIYENNTNPNNWVETIFSPSGCGTWSSRSNVKKKYLNKYADCSYTNEYTGVLINETLRCNIIRFD